MALVERLMGIDGHDKLPVHQYLAGVAEVVRGEATQQQLIDAFMLDQDDVNETQALYNRITTGPSGNRLSREEIHDVLLLAERKIGYDTPAKVRDRLGL